MVAAIVLSFGAAVTLLAPPAKRPEVALVFGLAAPILHVGLGRFGAGLQRDLDRQEAELAAMAREREALEAELDELLKRR